MRNLIGTNIKRLRESRAVTQEQLASALNITFQAVSKWETGATLPDTLLLPQIARFFGVTIDDLFRETGQGYENQARRLFAEYEDSRSQSDFLEADKAFRRLLQSGDYTVDDLRTYGILYQYRAKACIDKALELFDQALEESGEARDVLYYRVVRQRIALLAGFGRGEECIREQLEILEKEPDNPENYMSVISAYYHSGKHDLAQEWFERAAAAFPDFAGFYVYGGDLADRAGLTEQAFACWHKALELDDTWTDAFYSLALCCERLGRFEEARRYWEEIARQLESAGLDVEARFPRERADKARKKCRSDEGVGSQIHVQ